MLIIMFLFLPVLVGQAKPRVFSITSVISNCESNYQNCAEGILQFEYLSRLLSFTFFSSISSDKIVLTSNSTQLLVIFRLIWSLRPFSLGKIVFMVLLNVGGFW